MPPLLPYSPRFADSFLASPFPLMDSTNIPQHSPVHLQWEGEGEVELNEKYSAKWKEKQKGKHYKRNHSKRRALSKKRGQRLAKDGS
ncbi:hypothetical protein PILCRDRAFT_16727 [Piloderma croceum F 1598]|uniref:Uncharacterized protein n=1 Tax=Piloderma croceum (strain F 1598) TaxID=765440 RepID=A0A0C3EGK7_PILCF|nr:hypothetical protein PILCRDRAFT_16727 [Piloderma croceum F 1598]